jgi:hypothetical protein
LAGNDQLKEWKRRWTLVEEAIQEERSQKSDEWRVRQTLKLNATGRILKLHSDANDEEPIRERWRRLREVIGDGK